MLRKRNPLPQLISQRFAALVKRLVAESWLPARPLAVSAGPDQDGAAPTPPPRGLRLRPLHPGDHVGPPKGGWSHTWMRVDIPRPEAGERGRRHLRWNCQGEATAWLDGEPYAGFDVGHRTQLLPDRACTLWLQVGHWATGIWVAGHQPVSAYGARFDGADLLLRDEQAWSLARDGEALQQVLDHRLAAAGVAGPGGFGFQPAQDRVDPLLRRLLRLLDDACEAWEAAGRAGLAKAFRALFAELKAAPWQAGCGLLGHAHIDLVWLWPEAATEFKGVHTFATQLRLMERYPEFRFSQSQPALYRAIERRSPALARQVGRRIREGRWEVMGGFEVEPDNHMPCGEALARSLRMGQEKTAELSGRPSSLCWIPDVFGYSAALPQILRLGGVTRFFTTKMTWSAITKFPYNSFVWRGHDGSEILTHLCTTGYNGAVEGRVMHEALADHRQADVHPDLLWPTGYGDGGGGVSEEMIERARRYRDLAGQPRARWTSAEDFFDRLEAVRERLPTYQGELYLEYHRGTFTTQSEYKRLFRGLETALQAHEAVRVLRGGGPIDQHAWRRLCFGQFHDAIPGSSIGVVYQQLNQEFASLGAEALASAEAELARGGRHAGHLVFNPLPLPRSVVVELPAGAKGLATPDGLAVPVQRVGSGRKARLLARVELPALGSERLLPAAAGPAAPACREAGPRVLDNGILRAVFGADGRLAALRVDGRDIALSQPAAFVLHGDHPANFDAWDIDHAALSQGAVLPAMPLRLAEHGPLRAVLAGETAFGAGSSLAVRWILEAGSPWLRVEAGIAWHEDQQLLKFHLPTTIQGRFARFGCPFGSVQRPQLPGVPADEAQWEVPGSRWAAVTDEAGIGAAIISEAKYGFSCREGVLGLSLLRAPKDPDPKADRGEHRIRFAIGAHAVRSEGARLATAAAADALFAPALCVAGGALLPPPFALEDLGSLVPSWCGPAQPGPGWILRLHETAGIGGSARLVLNQAARDVAFVDFLEGGRGRPRRDGRNAWRLDYQPYEVLSLRVVPS